MSVEETIAGIAPYASAHDMRAIHALYRQLGTVHPINVAPTLREIERLIAMIEHEHAIGLY